MIAFVGVALWIVLETTSLGRTVLAIGGGEDASTLMRLKVNLAKPSFSCCLEDARGWSASFWRRASGRANRWVAPCGISRQLPPSSWTAPC